MKTFIVKSYHEGWQAHKCDVIDSRTNETTTYYVDLLANEDFPKETMPADLIGRKFTGKDYVYTSIATDLKEVP